MKLLLTAGVLLLLAIPVLADELTISEDPDGARLVVEDIDRFWQAWDQRSEAEEFTTVLQSLYIDPGSAGLQDFVAARIGSAEELAKVAAAQSDYYESMRQSTTRISSLEPAIRASFYAMEYLYPDANFPDVYFLIGRMNSGGTTSYRGLLIGAEMYGRTEDTPLDQLSDWLRSVLKPVEAIPHIVAHELIHFQQADPIKEQSLLDKCVREGMGDFFAELISGKHINEHVHAWALPRERELWESFQRRMDQPDHDGWLYGGQPEGWPADLGYFIGYRICEAYFARAADKHGAIREMLLSQDASQLLAASGYEP